MDEKIDTTSTEMYARQPVQIRAAYSRKLKKLADTQHRSMTNLVEFWIDNAWAEAHPQPISDQEAEERR